MMLGNQLTTERSTPFSQGQRLSWTVSRSDFSRNDLTTVDSQSVAGFGGQL